MIEWVFLDVGNVLVNDDPQNFHSYRMVHDALRIRDPDYTFEVMLAEREELALQGASFILRKIVRRILAVEEAKALFLPIHEELTRNYDHNNVISAGAVKVLSELRSKWRLGIIANQSLECRPSLARRGLLEFFDVVAISDELKLHKPDVAIYRWALAQSGCDGPSAVMVGDRRDNDIAPASEAGMKSVLVHWPSCRSKGWNPDDPRAQAFLDSCDRVPLFSAVPVGPEPDRQVASLFELPQAIASLAEAEEKSMSVH